MKYLKFFGNSSEVGDGVNVETPNISYLYKTNTVFVSKRKGKNATIVYDQEDGKIEYQPYEPVPLQSLSISGETNVMSTATYSVQYTPSYTFETGVTWSIVSGSEYASINPNTGVLTALSAASSSEVVIRATSIPNSAITAQKTLSVSYPSLQSISISGETNVGNTATYTVVYTPSNTPQKGVTWSIVSGSEYASINASTGVLTALSGASGSEVVIKATSTVNSGITDQKTLSVSYVVALQSISISGETDVTNSSVYSVQYTPSNTTQTGVTWSIISGSQYASINASTGALTVLSGASSSNVTIQATSVVNSAITAQKTISVSYVVPLQSISISGETNVTGSTTCTVQYTPSNTTQTGVTWSIVSGSEYASINASTGVLTALSGASGSEVVIRATSIPNSSITAQKTLSVSYPSGDNWLNRLSELNCQLYAPLTNGDLSDKITGSVGAPKATYSSALPSDNLTWNESKQAYLFHVIYGGDNALSFPQTNLQSRITGNDYTWCIKIQRYNNQQIVYPFGIGYTKTNDVNSYTYGYSLQHILGKESLVPNDGNFHTLTVTVDYTNKIAKFYSDGTEFTNYARKNISSSDLGLIPNWKTSYYDYFSIFGTYGNSGGSGYNSIGYIKNIYFFNKILTQAEIQEIIQHDS